MTTTTTMKHDYQLQDEMDAILTDCGLDASALFERKRGRISLRVKNTDAQQAINLLMSEHPQFSFSYENPAIGEIRFLIFVEIV